MSEALPASTPLPHASRRAVEAAWRQVRWVLAGYAQVLFTTRPVVGALALVATFVNPEHGLTGLLGLAAANLGAWLLELDELQRHEGYYAFNGLLVGLALGLFYRLNAPFVLTIVVGGVLVAALAAGLRTFFVRTLGVPVLSLPFLLVAWALYAAAARFPELEVTLAPVQAASPLGASLPLWLDTFLRSCGAIFFQLSAFSGALVAAALLVWSRVGFVLAVVGYIAGELVYRSLGGDPYDLTGQLIGFNFMVSAVAVGGVWTVPTLAGFGVAAAAGTVAAIITAAASAVLPQLGVPVLALPLIATTQLMLLALRSRTAPRRLVQPETPGTSPEATLHDQLTRRERFVPSDRLGLPLPVGGRWRVTQSFDGPHTHRGLWRHGLDLEAIDEDGSLFRGAGAKPSDFYAFGAPVFAPLAGRVVTAVSYHADRAVGEVDADHPWGNTVVLWHGGILYSAYSHLAEGSVTVTVGADVAAGALIGRVGSTGRSPTPHLHVQAQLSPSVGAPTAPWTLLHWLTRDGDGPVVYHTDGVPDEGVVVEALSPSTALASALAFPLGQRLRFRVEAGGKPREERWTASLDFSSRLWLTSEPSGARLRLYKSPFVLLAEAYEGPRDTALYRFYRAAPRVPLTDTDGLAWRDRLEPGPELGHLRRVLAELALPVRRLASLATSSELGSDEDGHREVRTSARLEGPLAHDQGRSTLIVKFGRDGLLGIEERAAGRPAFVATHVATELIAHD